MFERILSCHDMEEAVHHYGVLPFFRNNIRGFSVEEMTSPGLLFGGNEFEGAWEWKGPVIRNGTTLYGKFFRKKAGFISKELFPYFMVFRRQQYPIEVASTDEMIYDIIRFNESMTSTLLRESLVGTHKRRSVHDVPDISLSIHGHDNSQAIESEPRKKPSRHSIEAPLQRLQMGGWLCISDFKYKVTKRGEKYGWGVAEYSTPESLFEPEDLKISMSAGECLEYIIDYVGTRFSNATENQLKKLMF